MTSSPPDVRVGSQLPRIEHYPLFHTSAGDDAIDLAAVAGLVMDPWQEHILRRSLGERQDGRWSAFRVALVLPRQNGKNAVLEARELAGLFLFGEQKIVHTAHQFKTVKESMKSMTNLLMNCPPLLAQVQGFHGDPEEVPDKVQGIKVGHMAPGITLKGQKGKPGAELQYATRSRDSGRGFTGDLVVLDEAYSLSSDEMAALVPTMAARSMHGNPQLWFTSSAGMLDSDLLQSLRKQGIEKTSNRLAYFEWSALDDAAIDDIEAWYQANPALGIRISEEFIRDEWETMVTEAAADSRAEPPEQKFKRERLGIWAKLGGEPVIPAMWWRDALDEDAELVDRVVFGVDIPPSRDSAVICMAGTSKAHPGKVSVAVIDQREGTDWVPARLKELRAAWKPVTDPVLDPGAAAGSLLPALKLAKVRVKTISVREIGQTCGTFFDLAKDGKLRHPGQEQLDKAIKGAGKRKLGTDGSAWAWSRLNSSADISPLVAATNALYGLLPKSKPTGTGTTPRPGITVMRRR